MTVHELKTWPNFFDKLVSGEKTFEFRKNDRNFCVGDMLRLMEWNPDTQEYTNREMLVRVPYIFLIKGHGCDGCGASNYVVMSIVKESEKL